MKSRFLPFILIFSVLTYFTAINNSLSAQGVCGTHHGSLEEQIIKYPDFYQSLEKKNNDLRDENSKLLQSFTSSKESMFSAFKKLPSFFKNKALISSNVKPSGFNKPPTLSIIPTTLAPN